MPTEFAGFVVSSSTTDALIDVLMPQMGTSVSEGTIVVWHREIGDQVAADETICEISTDKIDTECPSPATGRLAEIIVDVGQTVDVGTVIARIDAAGEVDTNLPYSQTSREGSTPARHQQGEASIRPDDSSPPRSSESSVGDAQNPRSARRYSPVVQRIAERHGVELSLVPGSGRGGRVTKKDVLSWIEATANGGPPAAVVAEPPLHTESPYQQDSASMPVAPAGHLSGTEQLGGVSEQLSRMRQNIGAAMLRSQRTAAACTTIVECDLSQVERLRGELGTTALPLIARATIETLREFPNLNATLDGTTITRYQRVHLGIAVSLGAEGLIVPVIHDAQRLAAEGLAHRISELAKLARAQQLSPDDVQGATFTITNPGQYGALIATPVINQPQVAILDVEAVVRRPVVVSDPDGREAIAIRPMVNLCMSWDHRAIDGAYAAQFLTALRRRLESP